MSFGGTTGSSSIAGSSDVSLDNPSTGQTLLYNSDTSLWVNGTIPTAGVQAVFVRSGDLKVVTGSLGWYNDSGRDLMVVKVRATVGTAPVGSSVIIDIKKNGTTIFSDPATRPTIAATAATGYSLPLFVVVADGDYLTADIIQVGSATPGSNLQVQVTMQ